MIKGDKKLTGIITSYRFLTMLHTINGGFKI